MMPGFGLVMLALVGAGALLTGLPVYIVLLGVSCFGAIVAVAADTSSLALLSALPGRLVGLLESDILQALPLFAAMGALLNRMPLASTSTRPS